MRIPFHSVFYYAIIIRKITYMSSKRYYFCSGLCVNNVFTRHEQRQQSRNRHFSVIWHIFFFDSGSFVTFPPFVLILDMVGELLHVSYFHDVGVCFETQQPHTKTPFIFDTSNGSGSVLYLLEYQTIFSRICVDSQHDRDYASSVNFIFGIILLLLYVHLWVW